MFILNSLNLNRWPYWLRGGVIVVAVAVIGGMVFSAVTDNLRVPYIFLFLPSVIAGFLVPVFCPAQASFSEFGCVSVNVTIQIILLFLQLFIFGALLGWLYDMFRKRKVASSTKQGFIPLVLVLMVAVVAVVGYSGYMLVQKNAHTPKTIKDAVEASGGTYMVIDPKTASPSDAAQTKPTVEKKASATPAPVKQNTRDYPKTIEDAVKASGGTYMLIDPKTASPSDVADTVQANGLTNSDDRNGNIVLKPGIKVYDELKDPLQAKAYIIKTAKNIKGKVVVHANDNPLFIKLLEVEGGRLVAVTNSAQANEYIIHYDFLAGKEYVVEVFNTGTIKNFDPDANYAASYFISLENVSPLIVETE